MRREVYRSRKPSERQINHQPKQSLQVPAHLFNIIAIGPDDSFSPIPGIAFSVSREKAERAMIIKEEMMIGV